MSMTRLPYWTNGSGPATTIPPTTCFCTLVPLVTGYVFLGRDAPPPADDPDLLGVLNKLTLPDLPDSIQTLLRHLVEGVFLMADVRSHQHRPVLGGWKHPNRCANADLEQYLYEESTLALARSNDLYTVLAADIWQLYRLGRAAQLDYQHQRPDAWKRKHAAFAEALLRVHQMGVQLCEIGGRWFAEVCLRRLFRDLWDDQFGPNVAYPDELKPYIERVKVPLVLRNSIIRLLRAERQAGCPPPPPFAEMLYAWEGGEWPQSLSSAVSDEEWAEEVPIRWV